MFGVINTVIPAYAPGLLTAVAAVAAFVYSVFMFAWRPSVIYLFAAFFIFCYIVSVCLRYMGKCRL